MKRRITAITNMKLLATIIFFGIISYSFFFVPPSSITIIVLFSLAVAIFFSMCVSFFLPRRDQYIIFIFIILFLATNYLAGFNLLNILLLISFIIGLKLLIK